MTLFPIRFGLTLLPALALWCMPCASQVAPPAGVQARPMPSEPTWPQPFELYPGERMRFYFRVGNRGTISAQASWYGANGPMMVSVIKPDGTAINFSGNNRAWVQYNVTAADLKSSSIWQVLIRYENEPSKIVELTSVPVRTVQEKGLASGSLSLQHPAAMPVGDRVPKLPPMLVPKQGKP